MRIPEKATVLRGYKVFDGSGSQTIVVQVKTPALCVRIRIVFKNSIIVRMRTDVITESGRKCTG